MTFLQVVIYMFQFFQFSLSTLSFLFRQDCMAGSFIKYAIFLVDFWSVFFGASFLKCLFGSLVFEVSFLKTLIWCVFFEDSYLMCLFRSLVFEVSFPKLRFEVSFSEPRFWSVFLEASFWSVFLEESFWSVFFGASLLKSLFWRL
jgi:hypothetical protein